MRASSPTMSRAKALRGALSLPEVILWDCLRAGRLEGLRFRRQHPVGPYILDFYCASAKSAVEVDGGHHDPADQMAYDAQRDAWLVTKGIRVMRVAASDVLDDHAAGGVLRTIVAIAGGTEIPLVYRARSVEIDNAPSTAFGGPPPPLRRGGAKVEAVTGADPPPFTGGPKDGRDPWLALKARRDGGGACLQSDITENDR